MTILGILISCEEDKIESPVLVENISSIGLLDNPTLYEPINISVEVDNPEVDIDAVNVYLDNELLLSRTSAVDLSFRFDPALYDPGEALVRIEVIQSEGEAIIKEYPITIHRKLLEVALDSHFFRTEYEDLILFASAADGSLLAAKAITNLPISFTLTTEIDIEEDAPYFLTLASRFVNDAIEIVSLKSIDDLSRSSMERFSPKSPRRRNLEQQWDLETEGFTEDILILGGNSPDYSYGYDHVDFDFSFIKWGNLNGIDVVEDYYIQSSHRDGTNHSYKWINEEDLNNGIILNVDDFSNQDLIEGNVDVSYVDGLENGHDRRLEIYGYQNDNDFSSNIYHKIWLSGVHTLQAPDMFINPVEDYVLNTSFHSYAHFLFLEDYVTVRRGTPLTNYTIPDWDLDFGIVDKNITFSAMGSDHYVGKILVSSGNDTDQLPTVDGKNLLYDWDICFNSVGKESLTLPELPEAMKSWNFGKFYETNTPIIKWVRVERYDGISDYPQYLNEVIKENNDPLQVSPLFEAKFRSTEEFNFFSFDLNNFFN